MNALQLLLELIRFEGFLLKDWQAKWPELTANDAPSTRPDTAVLSCFESRPLAEPAAPMYDVLEAEIKKLNLREELEDLVWSYPPYRAIVEGLPHLEYFLEWQLETSQADFVTEVIRQTLFFNREVVRWSETADQDEALQQIERSTLRLHQRLELLQGRGAPKLV